MMTKEPSDNVDKKGWLLRAWKQNPAAFKRTYEQTGGEPPGDVQAVGRCGSCGQEVALNATSCSNCSEPFRSTK